MNPARRCHFTFHLLYGLATVTLFIIPITILWFEIGFQMALLAFTNFCTGVIGTLQPSDNQGRVKRRDRLTFCTGAFISMVLISIATINPISLLVSDCDTISSDDQIVYICKNQKGYMIFLLVFMALLFILHAVALLWYTFKVKDIK